jgi:predicted nucleic acid-binding Zn ribbon protein
MRKSTREKLKKPLPLREILGGALKNSKINIDLQTCKLWDLWDHIVGPAIARNAQPDAIKGNLLIVHVAESTWMHHLQFIKEDMVKQLNEALGKEAISDIRFKVGSL